MSVTLIAAVAKNGVIGADNALPWRLKDEMAYFKAQTMGKPVLMGSKTFRSLPKPLAGRTNVILSKTMTEAPEDCVIVRSVAEALERYGADELMVAGGADVYAQLLPYADRLLLSELSEDVDGDAVFPTFDRSDWIVASSASQAANERNPIAFKMVVYERRAAESANNRGDNPF
ncbi:dihydrofolate reductase [Cohnella hashimotonis]|uniref:Dihydrofolate reductase n=1 Tax=Cohnella hashimotonis TaxID=2826895 RepID=A0ABT6TFT7_9BACL|nr:dihydrofolate reductase [Cohnella hashimotonis]MDI4645697.1 dihydrofolate reductase [Cohnella hashimotonis]